MLSYHYYEPPGFNSTLNFESRKSDVERLKCGGFLTEMWTTGSDRDLMDKLFEQADEYKQSWQGWEYQRPDPLPEIPSKTKTESEELGSIRVEAAAIIIVEDQKKTAEENVKSPKSPKSGSIQIQETSRTYPQAVAGFTDTYKFDKDSKAFNLSYRTNAACKSRMTEIYFNQAMHYPDGFDHELSPSESVSMLISEDGYRVILQHDEGIAAGTLITFSMKPKAPTTTTKAAAEQQHRFNTRPKTYQRHPFVPGEVRYPHHYSRHPKYIFSKYQRSFPSKPLF